MQSPVRYACNDSLSRQPGTMQEEQEPDSKFRRQCKPLRKFTMYG